jgi:putative ABC transport system permease protein
MIMLKYNLFTSFRSIRKNLSFSLINISGLSFGLALVIILLAWLQFEFSFDKFNNNADRIFRVVVEFDPAKSPDKFANTPAPLGGALKNEMPEVVDYVRFGSLGRLLVNYENEQFWEDIELADPSIFRIFSFKLLYGNPETALLSPASIILSEKKAKKYFRDKNPMGQTLFLGEDHSPYTVTGVMKDIPANSQLRFDFLGSFSEIGSTGTWGMWNYNTYILAQDSKSFRSISEKLPAFVKKISKPGDYNLSIQPLTTIHLHSRLREDLNTNTDIKTVYIISSVLFLVLILACINYMNMATARYTRKGKEAGLRKVCGATGSNLTSQFLCESFAITLSAFIIALILFYLVTPLFISLTGVPLSLKSFFTISTFFKLVVLILLISLIAGSYPAFMLSSVNPVNTLRDDINFAGVISVKSLRKGLVIFQFFVSIVLIACTLIIQSQMAFIREKNLGLTPEQVVVVPIYQAGVSTKYELYKKEILNSPLILSATAVSYYPGANGYNQNVWWDGLQENDIWHNMSWLPADNDIIKTLKLELVRGEDFPENTTRTDTRTYILNESAVRGIGWDDPIGKKFEVLGIGRGSVIGVVKDFNFKSLRDKIEPVAIVYYPKAFDNLMIKISTQNIPATIVFLQDKWKSLFSLAPFEFSFLSDDFQKMYVKETTTMKIITYVSILSLFISCIGLFGLVLFTIDRRIKEIGLRKVAGSTTGRIIIMLNLEFVRWIIVSFIIACPVIVYFMHKWLESFAYRINLNWWMISLAGLITIIISLITVSWHTWYVAAKNPVECLKHE